MKSCNWYVPCETSAPHQLIKWSDLIISGSPWVNSWLVWMLNDAAYTTSKLFSRTGQRKETPSNDKGSTCSRFLIPASRWKNSKIKYWFVSGFLGKMPSLPDKKRLLVSGSYQYWSSHGTSKNILFIWIFSHENIDLVENSMFFS